MIIFLVLAVLVFCVYAKLAEKNDKLAAIVLWAIPLVSAICVPGLGYIMLAVVFFAWLIWKSYT